MTKAVYILSAGRSGSTLLNLILGSHSNATAVGEITLLPKHIELNSTCTCGQPLKQCDFWLSSVADISAKLGTDLWENPFALDLGLMGNRKLFQDKRQYNRYRSRWQLNHIPVYASLRSGIPVPAATRRRFDRTVSNRLAVYEAIRKTSGHRVVADSSKAYLPGIALYKRDPMNTRLILLTRDGRASFFSRLKGNYGSRKDCMKAWRNYYANALPLLEQNVPGQNILLVKYEDMALDPNGTLKRICEFTELSFEPDMLQFRNKTHHVVGGNNMRFRSEDRIKLDTAWITGLKEEDKEYFEKNAGDINRRLGYK